MLEFAASDMENVLRGERSLPDFPFQADAV